ncbi:MAG TPA: 50S ribosomal protein L10 [Oligoflexia bacterium]|nr:50S ribosomal protein L10 [Oligoflexia bacterium]HMP48017.1 50S ribosomal protein L10 [Oligoflexia bacterium]
MIVEEKAQSVKEMAELFKGSNAAYVISYQGSTCAELTDLRKELRSTGASFAIVKNTLAKRAIASSSIEGLSPQFKGPVAVVWAKDDVVAPAKIVSNHAKKVEALCVKAGVFEGKVVSEKEVEAIATLPSREELLSKLLSIMNAPATRLLQTINAPAGQLVRTLEAWRGELEKR